MICFEYADEAKHLYEIVMLYPYRCFSFSPCVHFLWQVWMQCLYCNLFAITSFFFSAVSIIPDTQSTFSKRGGVGIIFIINAFLLFVLTLKFYYLNNYIKIVPPGLLTGLFSTSSIPTVPPCGLDTFWPYPCVKRF